MTNFSHPGTPQSHPGTLQSHPGTPRLHRPLRILMTESTSLSARQTLYALGSRHMIDVMDPDPLSQCRFSRFVRKWYSCPSYARAPEAFLKCLADRLKLGKYDVLLPTHEQVFLLSRFRDTLSRQVGLALPDFASMQTLQNKASFMRLLTSLSLPIPETVYVRTEEELRRHGEELRRHKKFPCFIKLSHSTAGAGVHLVRSETELTRLSEKLASSGVFSGQSEILIQQPARGVQSTVQAVFDRGRMVAAHLFEARALGVGGMSPARVSACHPVVFEQVAKVGKHVDWHGAVFIDYFYDTSTDRPEYIEANPRIGETVNATLCGNNLVNALLDVSLGFSLPDFRMPDATPVLKTQSLYMLLISKAYDGATRRDLVAELFRYFFGRGLYHNSEDELTRFRDDFLSLLPLLWISGQLLCYPKRSQKIVQNTIDNYSLPESAADAVADLPRDLMESWF